MLEDRFSRLAMKGTWALNTCGTTSKMLVGNFSFSNLSVTTYVTTHSSTLPSLYLSHSSFSNPSVATPTSQFILQPFFRFSYVRSPSLNSPGESHMMKMVTNWQFYRNARVL